MSREWKPGDVALVTEYGGEILALRVDECGKHKWSGSHWHYLIPPGNGTDWTSKSNAAARPLVVIDPEDREQVEALIDCYVDVMQEDDRNSSKRGAVLKMQAALRSLLEPPKPDEPTGLGAVVVDADGLKWTRADDTDCVKPWHRNGSYDDSDWRDIAAVRVLSEGVQS